MKKLFLIAVAVIVTSLVLGACTSGDDGDYNIISAEEVKSKIENNESITLVDIQVEDEFDAHHIVGAIATYAYPASGEEDYAKLALLVDKLNTSEDPIVIVCPAGGGGATRTVDYYLEQGISAERVFILENGQADWPYEELLADK
ncbi:rhodanese-like domain-containing protein [Bacillaceae bacterium IKA-2]|nr:rhodanese-like domain-containing protein [Bacillaceae bacterium IKA-2]